MWYDPALQLDVHVAVPPHSCAMGAVVRAGVLWGHDLCVHCNGIQRGDSASERLVHQELVDLAPLSGCVHMHHIPHDAGRLSCSAALR